MERRFLRSAIVSWFRARLMCRQTLSDSGEGDCVLDLVHELLSSDDRLRSGQMEK